MASKTKLPTHPTSRLPQLYQKHRSVLRRLDDLESRLASRAASHRRRATNLVGETPSFRRSHVRIFVSHRVEGGNDEDNDGDDEQGEGKDEKKAVPASPAAAGARPGGKDFSALLHSSAHQKTAAASSEAATAEDTKNSLHQQPPKKGVRRWTLVIEGGLLIKQLDHESAKAADARLEAGLPILGISASCQEGQATTATSSITAEKNNNNKTDNIKDNDNDNDNGTAKKSKSIKAEKADIPLRDQWRGGISERENEKDLEPLKFTHLFDKLEVELKVTKKGDDDNKSTVGIVEAETSAITRSGLNAAPETPVPEVPSSENTKTITWERKNNNNNKSKGASSSSSPNNEDSNSFFIVHNEESEFKPMGGKVFKSTFNVERIKARIKLYRRQGSDSENYVPSHQMCEVFFPTFIGKKAAGEPRTKDKSGKSKKRKRSGAVGGGEGFSRSASTSSAAVFENEASNSSFGGKGEAFASRQQALATPTTPGVPQASAAVSAAEEKDVHIPNNVTMDEALHAIFFYVRTRKLQDATDLSIVNNDEILSDLFGCNRMLFSAVRGLLIEKELLVKVERCTQPIIFNYEMMLDGAEPLTKKRKAKSAEAQKGDSAEMTRRRKAATNDAETDAKPESEQPEVVPQQTMLSCDVDVELPNLFPVRTRDVLRRIKYREFEYTSGRIKALRSLVSTKVDEETAKHALGDAVAGAGYAPYHEQVWMALAKGCHEGGEAQRAASVDLRTTSLMERLEEQCAVARGYWDVVDACQGVCKEKD